MRTVFSNSMCAHVWAAQSQAHGRSNSMSFRDSLLFSYNTVIAAIVKSVAGEAIALLTCRSYSMTTSSKHMPEARSAVSHMPRFYVPFPEDSASAHIANLQYLVKEYRDLDGKLRRARDLYSTPGEALAESADTARDYARAFGLTCTLDNVADAAAIVAFREAREARANTPAAIRKRAQGAAYRARKIEEKRAQESAAAEAWRLEWERTAPERAAQEAKRRAEWAAAHAKEIEEAPDVLVRWQAGESVYLTSAARNLAPVHPENGSRRSAFVRRRGENVETSQGATVPYAHAEKLFRIVARCRAQAREFVANGHTVHVGHFTVSRIDVVGNLTAGCHWIAWLEIARFAAVQGWAFNAADDIESTVPQ